MSSAPIARILSAMLLLAAACQPAPSPALPLSTGSAVQPTAAGSKPTVGTVAPTTAPTASPASRQGSYVVYGTVGGDVRILNPILQSDTASNAVTDRIFDPLVNEDPKTGAIVPVLAESWTQSPDGLVYTFKLRAGVTFHDGHPLTADDAKFTLDVLKTDKVRTVRTSDVEKIKSVEVVDSEKTTLRVTMNEVYCPFLSVLGALRILPKHLLENSTNLNEDPFNLKPIGSGPFRFVEWVKDDHITLQAYDGYWDGRPQYDRYIFRPLRDRGALLAQLKTGDVDIAEVEPLEVNELRAEPHLQIIAYYSASVMYLAYNTARRGLDDIKVRQALTYALDRQVIIDQVLLGAGRPMATTLPVESWAHNPAIKALEFSPDQAKALLDEAGWKPGPGGVRSRDGTQLKFNLLTNAGVKVREAIATIAQQQLKDVGVAIDLQFQDFASMVNRINKLDYDLFVSAVVQGAEPDGTYDLWHSSRIPDPAAGKEGFNRVSFSTPELDQLLDGARSLPGCDQAKRRDKYIRAQEIIAEGAPWNFLHQAQTQLAVNKRVDGLAPSTWRRYLYNADKWTLH